MKLRLPDYVTYYLDGEKHEFKCEKNAPCPTVLNCGHGYVKLVSENDSLKVSASSKEKGVRYIRLRWNERVRKNVKILGDSWERAYGDLQWQTIRPERCMPWYFAVSDGTDSDYNYNGRFTEGMGVKVCPSSLCFWQYDTEGVTLWLDIRNGGSGTELNGREIECATIIFREYRDISAFNAVKAFCAEMSPNPYKTDHAVYGSNNWYYAYGVSSHEEIVQDTRFLVRMCRGCENVPYMVIDDGWQPNSCDAPWDRGNARFPDMKTLAAEIKNLGARPGIWIRFLINGRDNTPRKMQDFSEDCYLQIRKNVLDPSHPYVLNYIKDTTERLAEWGYQLIKHDFSTWDVFGKWGFEAPDKLADDGWSFYDKTKTTAEILKEFYRVVRDSSNGAVIIGCNCIGHLCAEYHQLNRTGDDTSGFDWGRTVKYGVNCLAFRIAQNNSFFGADADCIGITGAIEWEKNKEWLKALSKSGSPMFVSCKPDILSKAQEDELKEAFKIASYQNDEFVPVDWMETTCPSVYLINGKEEHFNWYTKNGNESGFYPHLQ